VGTNKFVKGPPASLSPKEILEGDNTQAKTRAL